jgi:4-amino-4-deoxy-L-arabinose transferase-like glycosyltransferase
MEKIRDFIKEHKIFAVIALAAVFVHLLVFFYLLQLSAAHPSAVNGSFPMIGGGGDSTDYVNLAENMLRYHNFSLIPGSGSNPETFRTPAYPFFVAAVILFTGGIKAVPIFQIVLLVLCGFLVYKTALAFSSKYKAVGLIAAGLFMFDPALFFTTQFVTTESIYTFLLLISVYFLISRSYPQKIGYIISGISFGLSVLTRPSGILLLVPLAIFMLWNLCHSKEKGSYLLNSVYMIAALFLVVSPWIIRNGVRTGVYKIASVDSYNAINFNVPQYFNYRYGTPIEGVRSSLHAQIGGLSDLEQRDIKNSAIIKAVVWNKMRGHLLDYAVFHVSKSFNFFFSSGLKFDLNFLSSFYEDSPSNLVWHPEKSLVNSVLGGNMRQALGLFKENAIYIPESVFLLLVFILGLYWTISMRSRSASLFFGLIVMLALVTGQLSNPRYRIPVIPFMYITAAAGAMEMLARRRTGNWLADKR